MKIYDCFTYCGENDLLEIRLETLFDSVDKFIIIEGNRYFNGEHKEKFFNCEKFKKFKNKINYFFIENFPNHNGNNWDYEKFQRNQISKGLINLSANDIVLVSDVDEIPNLKNKEFLKFDSAVFLQKMYYYKFNLQYKEGLKWNNKWPGTKSCKYKFFQNAQTTREFRNRNIPWWRIDKKMTRYIEENGGWHFAYLMSPEEIKKKLQKFDHEIIHLLKNNYDKNSLTNLDKIKKRILNFEDPYNRKNVKLVNVKIDKNYPKYILDNLNKYKNYIL
jgi:beta-1,4-mannosyl-glycoprotein beta-1,4-N-acetylglucosaminyltransferase